MTIKRVPILCLTLSLILLTAALTHIFFPQLNNWKLLLAGERNTYTLCQPLKSTEEMRSDFREKTDIHFASIKGPEVITCVHAGGWTHIRDMVFRRVWFCHLAYV